MARGRPTRDPHSRPAINTLERLHMELGGQILENRQRYDELSHQMRHVEAVIKMLDPGYNLARITVKLRQPNEWFKRGTLYRRAVDVLRTATGPMTTAEIGAAILAASIEASTASRTMKARAWSALAKPVRLGGGLVLSSR
jgi:hypothetical protein